MVGKFLWLKLKKKFLARVISNKSPELESLGFCVPHGVSKSFIISWLNFP